MVRPRLILANDRTRTGIGMRLYKQQSESQESEEGALLSAGGDTEMLVSELGGDAAAGGAIQEANLDQKRLVDFFYRFGFFCQSGRQRVHADGATLILLDNGEQQLAVNLVEAVLVHFEHLEGGFRCGQVDFAGTPHLGVIPDPAEQPIRNAWRSAGAAGKLRRSRVINLDTQNLRRALQNDLEILDRVKLQPQHDSKARAQG